MARSDTYRHETHKFADGGLQLRTPVDLVPPAQYSRFNDVVAKVEGELRTRDGLTLVATVLASSEIHSLFRLNQEVTAIVGDRIVGVGTQFFTAPLPDGDTFVEQTGVSFSGDPLSVIRFRFTDDQAAWAIVADLDGMRKYRRGTETSGTYYQKLGLTAPTVEAAAFDNGVGNLDSDGGDPYDWRWTELNRVTNSESNPSPITQTVGSIETKRPTAATNPDTGFGGTGFTNPTSAFDGDDTTFASGSAASSSESRQSCQWRVWGASGGVETDLDLIVDAEFVVAGATAAVYGAIYYSLDGGTTWKTLTRSSVGRSQQLYRANVPGGTPFASILVRALVAGIGDTTVDQNITRRKIDFIGGEISIGGLLTGGAGDRTLTLRVHDIRTGGTLSTAATSGLTLSGGRKALVLVDPPTDPQVTHLRLYRRGGSRTNNHFRVGEFALSELGTLGNVTKNPGTAAGTNWFGPSNALVSNTKRTWYDNTAQDDLRLTNYGFAFATPATVRGIEVRIEGNGASGTAAQRQIRVGLTKDGTALAGVRKTAVQLSEDTGTPLESSTATIGDTRSIGNAALAMTVNEHAGNYVRMTNGVASGEMRLVASNTATLLTYEASEPDLAVGFGDSFEVVAPGTDTVVLQGAADDLWGTTWTEAEVEAATFGVLIDDNDATAAELRIDNIQVTVYVGGIEDDVADTGLGDALELDNDVPVSSVEARERNLPRIWGPFDERVLGCGDPDRPESVYFCKRGNADQWQPQGHIEVSDPGDPMQNGVVYNTRSFAFSRERMFELVPNLIQGITLAAFPTPCDRGIIGPWGLVVADAIYFVAKDGIYRTTGGLKKSIIEDNLKPLFPTQEGPGRDIHGLEAVDMTEIEALRLEEHNSELWFTYKGATTGARQQLIYDIVRSRWRASTHTPETVTVYSEESTISSLLVGSSTGVLHTAGGARDNATDISVLLRTGSFDQGQPLVEKEYGNVVFDLDPGGATVGDPVTITPFINGEASAQAAITVTGTGRQRVPLNLSDVNAFNIQFEITWARTAAIAPVLFQFDILWRLQPAKVKHWFADETDHGLPGFMHLRDMYVVVKSTADVTLTLVLDGTTQTYTIASTGGTRQKVFVPFNSNKAKLYTYKFESTADFQLWRETCEVRVKPWLTSLGYAPVKPFAGEVAG